MLLINTGPCENRWEALRKARQYKEQLTATLNQLNPYLTDEERLEKSEKYNEWKREDRKNNPEKYKEFDKQKYEKFSETMKEKARERYWLKKDEINEAKKDKYHNQGGKEKTQYNVRNIEKTIRKK